MKKLGKYIKVSVGKKLIEFIKNKYSDKLSKKNHKRKHTIEDIIYCIFYAIRYSVPWHENILDKKNKTIYGYYNTFCKDKIFSKFFQMMIDTYISNPNNKKSLKIVSTDTSFMNNFCGVEKIGVNKYNKNNSANKVSLFVDKKDFQLL